jgi:hypothetical protein
VLISVVDLATEVAVVMAKRQISLARRTTSGIPSSRHLVLLIAVETVWLIGAWCMHMMESDLFVIPRCLSESQTVAKGYRELFGLSMTINAMDQLWQNWLVTVVPKMLFVFPLSKLLARFLVGK